jgi:hypothetical protein
MLSHSTVVIFSSQVLSFFYAQTKKYYYAMEDIFTNPMRSDYVILPPRTPRRNRVLRVQAIGSSTRCFGTDA